MKVGSRAGANALLGLLMITGGCAAVEGETADIPPDGEEQEVDGNSADEKSLSTENGMSVINGLTSTNGLMSSNGLSAHNGLTSVNGIVSMNGLATFNGLGATNGIPVNCSGTTSCTGKADGLLDATRGLMKDAAGVNLASYTVRCALPSDRTITLERWDGQRVALRGELGLTPEWETGLCSTECQEKVSSCLLSLVNGSGQHVAITLSAAWATGRLGELPDPSLLKEAVFFGNIFKSPPESYVAVHRDWARGLIARGTRRGVVTGIKAPRMCSGVPGITGANYATQRALCPIKIVGDANQDLWNANIPGIGADYNVCFMTDGLTQALLCRPHNSTYKWNFPLTSFVSSSVW